MNDNHEKLWASKVDDLEQSISNKNSEIKDLEFRLAEAQGQKRFMEDELTVARYCWRNGVPLFQKLADPQFQYVPVDREETIIVASRTN